MRTKSLTRSDRVFYEDFLDQLLDQVASVISGEKRARGFKDPVNSRQLNTTYQKILQIYRRSAFPKFGYAAELFQEACVSWRSIRRSPPVRRRSVWVARMLWAATGIADLLQPRSSYVFLSGRLREREAYISASAIKVRVCNFSKGIPGNCSVKVARTVFEEIKSRQFREKRPNALPKFRDLGGADLTLASNRELRLLERIDRKAYRTLSTASSISSRTSSSTISLRKTD